jgi:hypothetical protein
MDKSGHPDQNKSLSAEKREGFYIGLFMSLIYYQSKE